MVRTLNERVIMSSSMSSNYSHSVVVYQQTTITEAERKMDNLIYLIFPEKSYMETATSREAENKSD